MRIGRFGRVLVLVIGGEHVGHRGGELVDVPVGVDVAGRLDRGVAEQLLDGLEVAGGVEHALAGGVAALVHPLAAGGAGRDDAGGGEAAIPPVVRGVAAHRLLGVAAHADARDRALGAEQVVRGVGADIEDVVFEVVPERVVGEGKLAHLLALGEDRQAVALVVEVLELDGHQRALAQAVVEQQPQAQPVAQVGLLGDDRAALVG